MNRTLAFSKRNIKELLRDPLSYIFCLGFPLVMLGIMSIVNESVPKEMTIFNIDSLSGGIAVFGLTFIMLFTCLSVSKDRSGAFMVRLYATPMTSVDFIAGYTLPVLVLSIAQMAITFAASFIVSLISGSSLNVAGLLIAVPTLIPSSVMMISFGVLFGSLFNEKAAPGLCSIVISLAAILGGIWFDAEGTGGVMLNVCRILPFYHSTQAARAAIAMNFSGYGEHLLITVIWAAAVTAAASLVFRTKMKADLS